ncbi:MAG: 4-hydroxythreonine-4-phosphate dehydrogenase PdxA [Desulfarculales bacterium]|jgi:4-hydroxythreonine-4-phosphate dehydrogenase|nr:4-hydroxythreonine-4-phosphate dehydrogenase PdxA [Desulfarculales bacterium]
MRVKIAVTLGDPAGVGPELAARVCHDEEVLAQADIVIVGQKKLLAGGARAAGLSFPQVTLKECGPVARTDPGQPSAAGGAQAGAFIRQAALMCLSGEVQAMTTAPVSKEYLNLAGYRYAGHTEMLAELAGGAKAVMMMAGPLLKVSLLSTHVPLRRAEEFIRPENIDYTCRTTWQWLNRYWGYENPRLAVAAFNPHAGENGLLGREEQNLIRPAVEALAGEGMDIKGPLAADALFWRVLKYGEFDAVVCMYHDQGLIPFKMIHFEDGVNVSLGLPFIRTSPDHGTAFDLAGQGRADGGSMKAAVLLAAHMARRNPAGPR